MLLLCAIPAISACEGDEWTGPVSEDLGALIQEVVLTSSIGQADGAAGEWFSRLGNAGLSPSGFLAAVDAAPPFVRVFEGEVLRAAFGERGGGPFEFDRAPMMAVGSDRITLIQSAVTEWTLDGTPMTTILREGPPVVAVTEGCGDDWVAYVPRGTSSGESKTGWLHQIWRDSTTLRWQTVMSDSVSRVSRGYGKPVLSSDGSYVALLHENGAPQTLHLFRCQADGTLEAEWSVPVDSVLAGTDFEGEEGAREEGAARVTVRPGPNAPLTSGMAVIGGTVLISRVVFEVYPSAVSEERAPSEEDVEIRSWFVVVEGGSRTSASGTVEGPVFLKDARAGRGVLFEIQDPHPMLLLIDEKRFLEAVRSGG